MAEPRLVPVDHDPFADTPQDTGSGPLVLTVAPNRKATDLRLMPVDHDPFAEPTPSSIEIPSYDAMGNPTGGAERVEARPAQSQESGARDRPSLAADIAQALPTGILKGAIGLVGLPGLVAQGLGAVADAGAEWATGQKLPEKIKANSLAVSVSPERLTRDFENLTGKLYQPQTTAGRYAQTVGEFIPGVGASLINVARFALLPGLASEAAGQATEGTGLEGPARFAGALAGGIGGALIPRHAPSLPISPVVKAADAAGINLTAAQRTGNPALFSAEDAMLGGARGPQAQNVAQAARAAQEAEVRAARDAIGARLGEAADGTQVRLDRPADAGGIVGQRVSDIAEQGAASLAARNAALQAERDALFRGAESASESMGARFNPQGFSPVEAGDNLATSMRAAADTSRQGYRQAYKDAFAKEGEVAPEFFTGVNRQGSQALAVPGAPINEFSAPISTRIKERLLQLEEPIVPDATLTPLASRTLDDLDRVANLNLGRIGNPVPGQEVAGVNLRGVEQARKIITSRIGDAKNNPNAAADYRALTEIAKQFDDQLERVFDSALFRGDDTALQAIRDARGAFAQHQNTFRMRARGDDAGATIQKIVDRNATPEEVANYVLGSSRVGDNGLSVRMFGRLKEMLGQDSPHLAEIRGAAWQKLTAGADAASPAGAQKLAQSINEFTSGRGSTLAKQMFSPDELAAMRRYSGALNTFSALAKNPVTKIEAEGALKTLMDVANQRLSPENMASALFGHGNRVTSAQNRLVDAVADIVGREGPEWAAIRQGQWQRLTGVTEGAIEMGPQKMSQRLHEFLNGEGKSMAEKLYTPAELGEMRKFAAIQKARIPPPGATNPSGSGNRLAALARQASATVSSMLGAYLGGPVGAAAGYAGGKAVEGVSNLRAASQARKLFSGQAPVSRFEAMRDPALLSVPAHGLLEATEARRH